MQKRPASRTDRARVTFLHRTLMGPDRIPLGTVLAQVRELRAKRGDVRLKSLGEHATKAIRLLNMRVVDVGWTRT
jgi:hypothetical protein